MKEAPAPHEVIARAHVVTFLGALAAVIGVVSWMIGPYLLSLFLGGTLAMLAYPVYQRLRAAAWGPRLAASAVTALMLILIVAPLGGFSYLAVKQGIAIGREMSELKEFSPKAITDALSRWQVIRTVIGDPEVVSARLTSAIQAAGQLTTTAVLAFGKGIPEFLLQLALSLIAFYCFLVDGERLMRWLLGLGVFDGNVQEQMVESFHDTTISAVLAGFAAAASQSVIIVIGFIVIGVPGAFLAGGLTFLFSWIPVLGSLPASLAGLLYLYVEGSPARMVMMVAAALGAGLVDNMVPPLVLKGRADMHPLVGLIAIIGGIQLFGILGVFIGPIMAAMLIALLRIWPSVGARFGIPPVKSR